MSIMDLSKRQKVGRFALYSRIMVILMQAFFNYLIPDHNAEVFSPPNIHRKKQIDRIIELLLGGFYRWDAIYFLHVAEHGYTYENTLAFFPLFPMVVRLLANSIFFPLHFCMNYGNVLLVSATVLNVVCFAQAAIYLCDLTMEVMGNKRIALKVVQLFCLNPASIFFSAPYSEVMFAMLSFGGMLHMEGNKFTKAACYFALSGATRSNGLINIAFLWHRQLKNLIENYRTSHDGKKGWLLRKSLITVVQVCMQTIIVTTPFFMYQYYASTIFCNPSASYKDIPAHILNYGNSQHYKMPHTGMSPWCHDSTPLSYSYIQKKHWNIDFLAYYTLKQIPNFILALPVLLIGLCASITYLRCNPWCCITLGLVVPLPEASNKKIDDPVNTVKTYHSFSSSNNFVYMVHAMALITFCMLFMHVQVMTRFIYCSSPILYFFLAWITTSKEDQLHPQHSTVYNGNTSSSVRSTQCNSDMHAPNNDGTIQAFLEWENSFLNQVIYIYLHMYFFIGIAAFSNFLPWT